MRMSIKSRLGIGAALAAATVSSVALAGSTFHSPIYVSYGSGFQDSYAMGQVGYARYASDNYEEIGCNTGGTYGGTPWATCWAQDAQGNYLSCNSTDPGIVATARSVNATSYVQFFELGGTCMNVQVGNSSQSIY